MSKWTLGRQVTQQPDLSSLASLPAMSSECRAQAAWSRFDLRLPVRKKKTRRRMKVYPPSKSRHFPKVLLPSPLLQHPSTRTSNLLSPFLPTSPNFHSLPYHLAIDHPRTPSNGATKIRPHPHSHQMPTLLLASLIPALQILLPPSLYQGRKTASANKMKVNSKDLSFLPVYLNPDRVANTSRSYSR